MKITEVNINEVSNGKIVAYARVTFEDKLVVDGFKVINGSKGLFVSGPSRQTADNEYKDIVFPITKEYREELFSRILSEYNPGEKSKYTAPTKTGKKAEDLPEGWSESGW